MARAVIKSFLPRITPEEAGLSSVQVEKFIDFLQENELHPHAFVLSRYGKVFAEAYFAPYNPYELQTVYSLSKSFTSSAVGLAIADGKLSLKDKVVSFFGKEELPEVVDEKLASLTVRDLLCMSTGQENEARFGENWARTFFAEPIKDEKPGTLFRYNSIATYMCAAILKKLGIDVEVYIKEKLLHPLGIYGTRWQRSPQGVVTGGWGLSVVPELIVKFGNVLLNHGMWEGKQLLPADYLKLATSYQIDNSWTQAEDDRVENDYAQGYGFQFWRCRHNCYRADGAYGQFCVVNEETGIVFAAMDLSVNLRRVLDAFFEMILLPLQKEALPKDDAAYASLQEKCKTLSTLRPIPAYTPNEDLQAKLDNVFLDLKEKDERALLSPKFNGYGLHFTDEGLVLSIDDSKILCGKGEYLDSETTMPMFASAFDRLHVFGAYTFEGDALLVNFNIIELLMDVQLRMTVDGDTVDIVRNDRQNDEYLTLEATVVRG